MGGNRCGSRPLLPAPPARFYGEFSPYLACTCKLGSKLPSFLGVSLTRGQSSGSLREMRALNLS